MNDACEPDVPSRLLALPPLRTVIDETGFRATRALGQNFLLDINLTRSIARLGGPLTGIDVIEVGPGPGGLTRALLIEGANRVYACDLDDRAMAALEPVRQIVPDRLFPMIQDGLTLCPGTYGADGARAIIANLPYNAATPLLINWLKGIHAHGTNFVRFMLLMFQKEVAERIVAQPSHKAYGRLSVMAQAVTAVKLVKTLPAAAFTPAPKVASAVVHFVPHTHAYDWSLDVLEAVVASAFNQRRKMVRHSLSAYSVYLEEAGIDPTCRAEDIPVTAYIALARLVGAP